jgi:predicted ABC-type ATPase
VPTADVRRRYLRSLQNLFNIYISVCDIVSIYDNTLAKQEYIAGKILTDNKNVYVLNKHQDIFKNMLKKAKAEIGK